MKKIEKIEEQLIEFESHGDLHNDEIMELYERREEIYQKYLKIIRKVGNQMVKGIRKFIKTDF